MAAAWKRWLLLAALLALAGAVVVSGFVALTLTPMMCSKLLRHNPNPSWYDVHMENWLNALANGYQRLLRWIVTARAGGGGVMSWVLQARWLVLMVMAWWCLFCAIPPFLMLGQCTALYQYLNAFHF